MSLTGTTLVIRGEVRANDDLVIEGRIEGPVWNDGHAVKVGTSATVQGDIFARDIDVLGAVTGAMVATGAVAIRSSAHVNGRVLSTKLLLADGAAFSGTVEPQHLDAALRVARHRHTAEAAATPQAAAAPQDPQRGRDSSSSQRA